MIRPVIRKTSGQLALQRLLDHILADGLGPGDSLPPERELAKMLDVSRNTLREVLKSIEMAGAIVRKPMRGTVLNEVGVSFFLELSHSMLPDTDQRKHDLMEARGILEVGVLPLVIQRATPDDFERMDAANRLIEANINRGVDCTEADVEFHKALLASAGNMYLEQFGEIVQELGKIPHPGPDYDNNMGTLQLHRQLVDCLRNRDLEGARQSLEYQLSFSEAEDNGLAESDAEGPGSPESREKVRA